MLVMLPLLRQPSFLNFHTVIGGLKQMATKHHLRGHRKRKLFVTINYLLRNLHPMHYGEYLAKGYPIGSGVVEGACRHFLKDRMELTGMRWRTDGQRTQPIWLRGTRAPKSATMRFPRRGLSFAGAISST